MASFTVIGGPSTLERHKEMLRRYRIRQAYIDGAKHSENRNGRMAMSNFMTFAPTAPGTSRIYTENVLRSYPGWVRDEVGRAFKEGQESGGNLYGSDLGWAAANYADSRIAARRADTKKKKKEDNSTYDSARNTNAITPGQDNTKASDASTSNATSATSPDAEDKNADKGGKPSGKTSKPGEVEDAVRKTWEYFNRYGGKTDYGSLTTLSLNPKALDETTSGSLKANNKGFDKFAKTDLGINSGGAKIAHSVILSSGVSEEQAITLSSVIDNWDNDGFIASIPSVELSTAISSLTAKLRSGTHTDRDLKLLAALKKRIMKVSGDTEVSKAGTSVANALN